VERDWAWSSGLVHTGSRSKGLLNASTSPPPTRPIKHPSSYARIVDPEIRQADINQDALRVVSRLQRAGHECYLVGGCVRDLLLGRTPKDFDVATSAHPRQVKRLFRNGRIVGRRFKLVHVVYGDHILETATFRAKPESLGDGDGDLLIREDNAYGSAEEDAMRRDFTINGLFFDPSENCIHDWVEGLQDLKDGLLRTIGNPDIRIAEDPVRIMRAIKFATRLGFRIEEDCWDAMCELSMDLQRSAAPRVLEEILRLMRSGTCLGAFRMMRACGALEALLPNVDAHIGSAQDSVPESHDRADKYWRLLEALDADVHAGNEPTNALLLATLFFRLSERRLDERQAAGEENFSWFDVISEEIDPIATAARFPRRVVERAKKIIAAQRGFTRGASKNFRPLVFMLANEFEEALHLFRLRSAAWGQGWDLYEAWCERYQKALELSPEELEAMRAESTPKRKRKRRRRRRSG